MALPAFDTLRVANRLKAVGVPSAQAEAEAEVLSEVFEVNLKELATKEDLSNQRRFAPRNWRFAQGHGRQVRGRRCQVCGRGCRACGYGRALCRQARIAARGDGAYGCSL